VLVHNNKHLDSANSGTEIGSVCSFGKHISLSNDLFSKQAVGKIFNQSGLNNLGQ
jgi:hypothetical protein